MDQLRADKADETTSAEFSVVICAHDERRWDRLQEAVRSVRRQTLSPSEIIVVVDHNAALFARAHGSLDEGRVIANNRERGLGGARNSGLAAATSPYVAFIDDDATASERWLEVLATAYSGREIAGVGGITVPVWESERPKWFPPEFDWVVGAPYRGMPLEQHEVRNLWGGNMSFRRELVAAVGGFRIGYSCDDTELCIRMRQRWPEKRFLLVPEARVLHHIDPSRMTVGRFLSRCYFEGGSKAVIAQLVGAQDALASERRYARDVLPNGLKRSASETLFERDPTGMARAGLILAGLASATAGYGAGLLTPNRAAKRRGWQGERLRRSRPRLPRADPGVETP